MSSNAAGVYYALGNTLVVETVNFFQGDLVLEKSRTGPFGVGSFQPNIGSDPQPKKIGEGRVSYQVSVLETGIPCMVVIPREGWSF